MKVHIEWAARADATLARALDDPRLSYRAKGLLAHLLSLPAGSALDVKQLAAAAAEGKAAIETALLELTASGYCERIERPAVETDPANDEATPEEPPVPMMASLFDEPSLPPMRLDELAEHDLGGESEGDAVERIIDHLNAVRERSWTWARYTPLSSRHPKNVEHIRGRLGEGFVEADLVLVLDYLAATDGGKEESRKYFDCVTPFNTKNFERNLAMAREWEARGKGTTSTMVPGTSRGKDYYLGGKRGNR